MAGQRLVRLFKMGLNYNLIIPTVNSLGLFQEDLTLKTDIYLFLIIILFGVKKNGCNKDLEASMYTHGIYNIY